MWCLGFLFPVEAVPGGDGVVLPMFQRHTPPQLSMKSVTCVPCHSFIPKVSTENVAILFPFKDNFILTVCLPKERIIFSVTHQKTEIVINSMLVEDLMIIISISPPK